MKEVLDAQAKLSNATRCCVILFTFEFFAAQ